MSLPIKSLGTVQTDLVFSLYAEQVVEATYTVGGGGSCTVNVLVLPVPLEQCDGVILKPGDDKVLVRCAELDSTIPKAGDTIQETVSGILRDVNGASSNISRQMWTCFCRRA